MMRLPQRSTLFPYTTLFRSGLALPKTFFISVGICSTGRGGGGPTVRPHPTRTRTAAAAQRVFMGAMEPGDRKSTRLNSSHSQISYAVFCLKKKKKKKQQHKP